MAYENLLKRKGRTSKRKRPLSFQQANWLGVDYSSSIYARDAQDLPYGLNADMGSPIGAISKAPGFEAVISSLGNGGMNGLHLWPHSLGDKMIAAWSKGLYLVSGGAGSIAKTTQADWEAGTVSDYLDTSSSPGDVKILKGSDFSDTATLTADFDGTHDDTQAVSDKVTLVDSGMTYSLDACNGGTPIGTNTRDAQKAFDNNLSTYCGQQNYGWTGYDFGSSPKAIRRLRMMVYYTAEGRTFYFQYSNDGSNWSTALTINSYRVSSTYPQEIDWNQYDVPDVGSHRYWRLYFNSEEDWFVREIEMMTYTSSYLTPGVYTHGELDPSGVKLAGANSITFNKTTPANTTVTVEVAVSEDEGDTWGDWEAKASGDSIVPSGTDISKYRIKWRATLATTDTATTPSLDDVTVSFTAIYYSSASLDLPIFDLGNTPLTNVLTFSQSAPENTSIVWYARGSSNGVIFGNWRSIAESGDALPLQRYIQIKFVVTSSTGESTPTISSLLISYSTAYTECYQLDINPLGRASNELTGNRVCMVNYQDWLLCANGLRPWMLYITDDTQITGTAQGGAADYLTLEAGYSTENDKFNNAFISLTGGTGSGQVRWIGDYDGGNGHIIPSQDFDPAPSSDTTYSIGAAIKVRNLGVDPPAAAPTLANSGDSGNPNGTYHYKVTFVNADGVEGNPSPASSSITVSSKKITVTCPSTTDTTITQWRIYRTANNGAVYKYVAEEDIGTSTYTDDTSDAALGTLMLDNNNIPPNCGFLYEFNGYVFYATDFDVWFPKAGSPDQVPNITGDRRVISCPGRVGDIKSHPMALIISGPIFQISVTSNSGFIFDSDPEVDTTTFKVIDSNGGLSWAASAMCLSPNLRSTLIMNTNTGLRAVVPGLQDNSVESVPLSYKIQPYYERSLNRDQAAGVFFNNYYLYSEEHMPVNGSVSERLTFALDLRHTDQWRWRGPWQFGMSCYTIVGNVLYAGDAENGIIYRMYTGNSYAGENIHMVADMPMVAPAGEEGTCKFKKLLPILSGDSVTTETLLIPKVDELTASIPLGELATTYTGDERPGHDIIRPRPYSIPLGSGHTNSTRIEDDSTNPLTLLKLTTEYEVLNVNR